MLASTNSRKTLALLSEQQAVEGLDPVVLIMTQKLTHILFKAKQNKI
jgi:hypothetical protein